MTKSNSYRSGKPAYSNGSSREQEPFFTPQAPVQEKQEDSFFQPKLSIGQAGDKYEKEADNVADKVVSRKSLDDTPAIQRQEISSIQRRESPIQRLATPAEDENFATNDQRMLRDRELREKPEVQLKCAHCEEEEKKGVQKKDEKAVSKKEDDDPSMVQRKPDESARTAPDSVSSRIDSSRGNGTPLPANTLTEMQSSFGTDFNNVNIHTDAESVNMNRELGAQAFTHGNDIYFNSGKFNPESASGKHLLAHELTHVIQQNEAGPAVQKKDENKHDLTSSLLAGDPVLESTFDGEQVIRPFAKGDHVTRLQKGLIQLGFDLPKFGADGNYGDETAQAVTKFQQRSGMSASEWDGRVGKKTIGLLDRSVRNGKVETDTDSAKDDFKVLDNKQEQKDESCKNKPTDTPCPDPNSTVIDAADQAIAMIDKVLKEQLPPKNNKQAKYEDIFGSIFRNNDSRPIDDTVREVRDIYGIVKDFLGNLKKDKSLSRCGTECDGGCRSGTPAYHTRLNNGSHVITFCPDFQKDKDRILIVLHESHHASVPGSSDKAYGSTRLFDKLDHTKALTNAASFHVYAAWVDTPGSQPVGQNVKDTNLVNDPAQKNKVNMSLAFIEQWFNLVPFDVSSTVEGAEQARNTGTYKNRNAQTFMEEVFSKWFGLTRPPLKPSKIDVDKLRAIEERVKKMEKAFSAPFVILETPTASFWEQGPGTSLALNNAFLQLDIPHMATGLLQELVHATPDISAGSEPLYVLAINDMRNLRGLDPQ